MEKTSFRIYFEHFLKGEKENFFEILSDEVVWSVKGSDNVSTDGQR